MHRVFFLPDVSNLMAGTPLRRFHSAFRWHMVAYQQLVA